MNDARVDAYVEGAAEFAQPILVRLRGLGHTACPDVEETIKWRRPFFLSGGAIVANMCAFKGHCSFDLWKPGQIAILRSAEAEGEGALGSLGRIKTVEDLPADEVVLGLLKTALRNVSEQHATGRTLQRQTLPKAAKVEVRAPDDLRTALERLDGAGKYLALSPSCQKEYVDWIEGAKRADTRERRIAEAVVWITEGKRRNWKHEAG